MDAPQVLDRLIKEIDKSKGYNPKASYQNLIERGTVKRVITDQYSLADPVKPQSMVVPKVLPAGVRSPSAQGTPARLESVEGRYTMEDFDLVESDLVPGRANKAGQVNKPMKKDDLYQIARQIKIREREKGGIQHFHSIPSTREPLVAALRKYFGLAPADEEDEEETEKKPRKKR